MKKHLFLVILLTVISTFGFSQTLSGPISMSKVMGGYQFYQGTQRLTMAQLVETMKSNDEAYTQIKSAQGTNTFNTILGTAGGFLVGYPIGTAIGGGEPEWTMAAVGAGLLIISIPISQKFKKQAKEAVETYNSGLETSFWDLHEINICSSQYGLGLSFKF